MAGRAHLAAVEAWPRQLLVSPGARRCRAGSSRVHAQRKRRLQVAAAGWHVWLEAVSAEGPLRQAGGCESLVYPDTAAPGVKWMLRRRNLDWDKFL